MDPRALGDNTHRQSETLSFSPNISPSLPQPLNHNRPTAATLPGAMMAGVEERGRGRVARRAPVGRSFDGAQVREGARFERLQTLEGLSVSASGTPGLYYINSQPGSFCSAPSSVLSAQISASPFVGQEN